MTHKEQIALCFNKAADTYDNNCQLQLRCGKNLIAYAKPFGKNAARIIDLGCGTGLVTQLVAAEFDYQSFHAIDISSKLLCKAISRLHHTDIQIDLADFDKLDNNLHFDFMFSNMTFQWSIDFTLTLKSITTALENSGLLAFSLPLAGTLSELQNACTINTFMERIDIITQLQKLDYEIMVAAQEQMTQSFVNSLAALQSLKAVGANYVLQRQHSSLKGKSILTSNLSQLTYLIGFFVARKRK